MDNRMLAGVTAAVMVVITAIITVLFFSFSSDKGTEQPVIDPDKNENKEIYKETVTSEKGAFSAIGYKTVSGISKADATEKPPFTKVSFAAVGDNIVHSTVYSDAQTLALGTGKEYNFVPMFENVADIIKDADNAYINQESPFGGKDRTYSGYPMFNSPDEVGYDLIELGFDVINLANNHMLDRYAAGYKRTIDFWKDKEGITYIGGYENKEDYENIRIVEKNGISTAYLSYTYGTNGVKLDRGSEMIIPLCDEAGTAEIDRQTKIARTLADVVIVSVHWGYEDNFTPSALQEKQTQIMVNNGVDVIIGTHPHVLQPMCFKQRPDGKKTLVIYSLGNFLSGMLYVRNMVGGIATFDVVKAGDEVFVQGVKFIPTVCHYDVNRRSFKVYKLTEYTEELFALHGANIVSDRGKSVDFMRNIIEDAIPKEFLPDDFYVEVVD